MYIPRYNQLEDRAALLAYMRAYSFAALATSGPGGLTATHLPFVIEEEGGRITLLAHMAKANPQWRDFAAGVEALVIFMQPHAYVSPRLYDSPYLASYRDLRPLMGRGAGLRAVDHHRRGRYLPVLGGAARPVALGGREQQSRAEFPLL